MVRPGLDPGRVPDYVKHVMALLSACGYSAFIVGGAPRDLLLGQAPLDWDVASTALPEQVIACVSGKLPYRTQGRKHGTITLMAPDQGSWQVEVTTLRTETGYSDGRRPDSVRFVADIEQDLARRDFTANAIALGWPGLEWVDPFGGISDIRRRIVRAVGDPVTRFGEDGLRLLRAVRLVAEKGWRIEKLTYRALKERSRLINKVSRERVRDEFSRILTGEFVLNALKIMLDSGLLVRVVPEFSETVGFVQHTRHHKKKLDDHILDTVRRVPRETVVRLAALLHDIAKPRTFELGESGQAHFYGHHKLGAQMARDILRRLRYDKDTVERVSVLVEEHMFSYGPALSDAGVRRLVRRVGKRNLADLFELRRADILASGGLMDPWLDRTWDRVVRVVEGGDAVDTLDLAVDGNDVMRVTGLLPGPAVGKTLTRMLEHVIERPQDNSRDTLLELLEKGLFSASE